MYRALQADRVTHGRRSCNEMLLESDTGGRFEVNENNAWFFEPVKLSVSTTQLSTLIGN